MLLASSLASCCRLPEPVRQRHGGLGFANPPYEDAAPRKKGAPCGAPFRISRGQNRPQTSQRIIHLELDRMRGHLEALDLRHLQLDIGVDEIVVEHAAVL